MKPDLETRLRQAAELLDEQASARMATNEQGTVAPKDRPVHRRRWIAAVAAACLALAGIGSLVIIGGESSSRDDQPPAGPTSTAVADDAVLEPGWNELPEAPISPRFAHLTVPTKKGIFVWGGLDDTSAVFSAGTRPPRQDGAHLDVTSGTWQQAPPFPFEGTTGVATGVWIDGRVIVITELADPEVDQWYEGGEVVAASYDPDDNTWLELPPPPIRGPIYKGPRPLFAVDELAVFVEPSMDPDADCAGRVASEDSADESPDTDETGETMVCDDQAGEVSTTVTVFDPATDQWTQGNPPPAEMYEAVWGTEVGDQILVAGPPGDDTADECHAPLYLYTPATDEWETFSEGPDDELAINGLTWTGDALFGATPDVCHGPMLDPGPMPDDIDGATRCLDFTPDEPATTECSGSDAGQQAGELSADTTPNPGAGDPRGRLTSLDGEHTSFAAPAYVTSVQGWWTGTSVAMISDDGLPLFYEVESGTWHEAPAHDDLRPPGSFGDRGYWRGVEAVWSNGAMVSWSGIDLPDMDAADTDDGDLPQLELRDGGLAYVPPQELGTG